MSSATGTNFGVCDSQESFNKAFNEALKKENEETVKKIRPVMIVYILLWLTFFIWAIVLALRNPEGPGRIVHLVLAMAFSPLYVIAYYLQEFNKN